ncbi:glycosyltransferase family 4 protein [Sphingobacterium multivorum]|uniref:glycosyltransferase family 4 protein n=1 Tax=Sphingobacterium multivorum TaxID=28454 RepID=UPI0031BA5F30
MMKDIVFVTPQVKTGGGNRVFFELANILVDEYNVKVIFPNNSEEKHTFEVDERIQFISIGDVATTHLDKIKNVINTFFYLNKHERNSNIIISDPIMAVFSFILSAKFVYRFVQADDFNMFNDRMIIRSQTLLYIYKFLTRLSFRYKYKFIFNSLYSYGQFCKYNKGFKEPPLIVHPALNHSIFNVSHKKGRNGKMKQLCLVARKHPLKGLQIFIDAWKRLSVSYKDKINKVVLITHDDLNNYDVSDFSVINPTSDTEIAEILCVSDIFISTSLNEGFGLPPLEAMACGSGVIISDSGGVREFAQHDFNCLMFPAGNVDKLVEQLKCILNDEVKLESIQRNGLITADQFGWESSAKKLVEILAQPYEQGNI